MSRATATPDNSNINRRDAISVNPREPDLKLRIVFLLIFLSGSFFPSNGMRSISISRARNRVLLLRSQVAGGDRGLQIQTLIAVVGILLAAHAHMSDVDLGDHDATGSRRPPQTGPGGSRGRYLGLVSAQQRCHLRTVLSNLWTAQIGRASCRAR